MTGAIASVGTSTSIDAVSQTPTDRLQQDPNAFLDVLDKGLSNLASRPNLDSTADSAADGFSKAYGGEVGNAKIDMIGGDTATVEKQAGAEGATLEDKLQSLYFELTHYQVAWKIAQNVQRDVSQVLRGS